MLRRLVFLLCAASTVALQPVHLAGRHISGAQEDARSGAAACEKKPGDTYVVLVMFAGRRDRLSIGLSYVDELIASCQVDEVHLWNYTRTPEDAYFLESLSWRPVYRVWHPAWREETDLYRYYKYREVYNFYRRDSPNAAEPRWRPQWEGASGENTVIVKLDDDIVFVDVENFPCFVKYVRTHKDRFLVSANVVNNPVADFYRTQYVHGLIEEFPHLATYPYRMWQNSLFESPTTDWGSHWPNGTIAYRLHAAFLEDPVRFILGGMAPTIVQEHDECIAFAPPMRDAELGLHGQGRIPINFVGIRWEVWNEVWDLVSRVPPHELHTIDEVVLTEEATKRPNHEECIYMPLVVAHMSFSNQVPEADGALIGYKALRDEAQPYRFRWPRPEPSCAV
mmetsp:Transcript_61373/g.176642  ORF Transcript_61373/g.176642 Transcript_61373/m.176642 type:complete len:394 (-) Transcript_61373:51-1232(-)